MTVTKWPYHSTMQFHGVINKPPVYDSYTVRFVEQPSFDYSNSCGDK